MRKFLIALVLIFSFQSSKADNISDFEIEGISIGDSLLDHLSKDLIDKLPAEYYPKSDKFYVVDGSFQNSELYDGFQVGLKKNEYKVYGITAGIFFDNMKNCLTHKNKVENEISEMIELSRIIELRIISDSFASLNNFAVKNFITPFIIILIIRHYPNRF